MIKNAVAEINTFEFVAFVSALIFIGVFGTKMIIHLILDRKNNYPLDLSGSGIDYFFPYDKEVRPEDLKLKELGIRFHLFVKYAFSLFLICFVLWRIKA